MVITGQNEEDDTGQVVINGQALKRVLTFKYLVDETGGYEKAAAARISAALLKWRTLSGVMCDKQMPKTLKGKVYKTVIRPVLMYGSETWALRAQDTSKIAAAEMKILRWSSGHTKFDRIRNTVIREGMKVAPIEAKLRENRLRWLGHVQRREDGHVCKAVQTWKVDGKGKRGRPKLRWTDCIKEDLREAEVDVTVAADRAKWRKLTHHADPI